MRLRLFHPSRFWALTVLVAGMHFLAPRDDFAFALLVWNGYTALLTAVRVWRRRLPAFVLPSCGYTALAATCGAWPLPTLAAAWACTLAVALIVDAPRLVAWLARRCLRAWRERRERRRAELHPVSIVVPQTTERIDAGEVLHRLGLVTE